MKKFLLTLLALCALVLCSCASSKAPAADAQNISVCGVLQVNDKKSYFIIVGGETKSAQTFFLTKDSKNGSAWKTLVSSVGKTVYVHGKLVNDGGPWLKTLTVDKVSFQEQ